MEDLKQRRRQWARFMLDLRNAPARNWRQIIFGAALIVTAYVFTVTTLALQHPY